MISATSCSPGTTVVAHHPHHHHQLPTTSSIGEKCIPLQQATLVGADQLKRKRSKQTCNSRTTIRIPSLATASLSMDTIPSSDTPAVSDNDTDNTNDSETTNPSKRRKTSCSNDSTSSSRQRRVSFSNGPQSIVEVETLLSETDKHNVWYKTEDYTHFVTSAHFDAQRLRNAAQCATSSEALYMFIQSSDLSPRGLEKVLQYASCSSSDEEEESSEDDDSSSSSSNGGFQVNRHSRRVRLLKSQHREMILLMHRNQKESGAHKPEELRKFSEDSSRWAVETALKLGHIDAQGLL